MDDAGRTLVAAKGPITGTIRVPGSKSLANRALVAAALAEGRSEVTGLPDGDDTAALLEGLTGLGVHVVTTVDPDRRVGIAASVVGVAGRIPPQVDRSRRLDARLAGTTSRFLTAVAALATEPVTVDGDGPLRGRPMGPLHDALRSLGATVETPAPGHLPVTVTGRPTGRSVELAGDISSQYVTALMLIAPCLDSGLTIGLTTPLVSRPYVQMTVDVMGLFGSAVDWDSDRIVVPPGGYVATRYDVEPDASSAAYPLAMAAARGGRMTADGLPGTSSQPDIYVLDVVEAMGCRVERSPWASVSRDPAVRLGGLDVDLTDRSDLVPTVAVLAVTADSPTRIRGVGFVRGKESDRLGDLATELRRVGADIDATDDGLDIRPVDRLTGARLFTHHDHRLAMAFGVLGTVVDGIEIESPGVVTKSWPSFWTDTQIVVHPSARASG